MGGKLRQQFVEHIYRASASSRPLDDRSQPGRNQSLVDHLWVAFRECESMNASLLMRESIIFGILWPFPSMREPP
jgi:hypothetical protein